MLTKPATIRNRIEEARRTGATELDLSCMELKQVPALVSQLDGLVKLNLSYNRLTQLPDTLGALKSIQDLDLTDNFLTELPDSISNLTNLRILKLAYNRLIELPLSIGRLAQLEKLYLTHNRITALPESIGQLKKLKELYLNKNDLSFLPKSLRSLPSLEKLYLHDNYTLGLSDEVLGPTWQEASQGIKLPAIPTKILNYYFRYGVNSRPLNEAKLILVGRGAVGKTSIINRVVHNTFSDKEAKTEGINITEWDLLLNEEENVRLNIWDFGGQEIMHATHQFFLTKRSLYLLVINGRDGGEDSDAEYWLKLIESFGEESPIIIVLNKISEHPFDLNRSGLRQKYPAIREFIKTDCEVGTGIVELRAAIERETNRLEHLRDPFPANWLTIKDRLGRMKRKLNKDYLSFKEYRNVCAQYGEDDSAAQEQLANHLHNLGIVVNYKGDPRLQDTHVLNPHWVTKGIYKIINSEMLEEKKGVLHLLKLTEILNKYEYPPNMQRFIIDLMEKFELCFSFPQSYQYLIPELLDKQQPIEALKFKPEQCLNFQYHYAVLPEGLLPRFIVRTHSLSEGLKRWRTGVILEFEDCHALVKADVQDKKVFIHVSGPLLDRRRLLAVIRSDFERIHRDIRNLQPKEMIPLPDNPNVLVSYQELLVMERNGIKKFPKVVGNHVAELDTHSLLNGIDIEGARVKEAVIHIPQQPVHLFYSYSHVDEKFRNELETHLKLLQRRRLIESWHDRKIGAGFEWRNEIDEKLERAHIILLLVSSDFIASDYCYDREMKRALDRHAIGEARVIPIIIRDVNWAGAPFAKLQVLPKDGLAVTKWEDRDSAWRTVSEKIEKIAEEIRRDWH